MNNFLITYKQLIIQGITTTLVAWVIASMISITIGILLGIAGSKKIGNPFIIKIVELYTFTTRAIPAYVQILIAYFVIPATFDIQISGFIAGTCALAICSSGYSTEIVKSGLDAICQGQWDACHVLGFSTIQKIRYIILPQALTIMTTSLLGEYLQLIKSTSLLASIGVTEVTRAGMNIVSRQLNPVPVYCAIACFYLICTAIFNGLIIITQKTKSI